MKTKKTEIILILLWLTGCAAMDPIDKKETTGTTDESVRKDAQEPLEPVVNRDAEQAWKVTGTTATIEIKSNTIMSTPDETEALSPARLLERLDRVATQENGSMKQQIKQMDAKYIELDPADKYELVLLLSRKGASSRSLNRAIDILDDLQAQVNDRIVQKILQLHRHNLDLEKQYRSERNKTIELKKKIEHLKGLEQDLDKSDTRIQESLNPMPGDAQQQ